MYRTIKNDINISDIRYMYEVEKLSQREIAQRLGIAQSSVSRYIGVRTGIKRDYTRTSKPVTFKSAEPVAKPINTFGERCEEYLESLQTKNSTAITYKMDIIQSVLKLKGKLCNYTIDTVSGSIELNDGVLSGLLDKGSLDDIISELTEIKSRLEH